VNGRVRPALFVLAAAVLAVMLIVSANLASLQYARMVSRRRERAVRLALGAARGRLVRQALTESLVLAGAGALLGVALALGGTQLVSRLTAFDIPLLARVGVNITALGVALLVAVVTGVLAGVLPALHAPADVNDALKDGHRGSTRGGAHARVRSALVVAEIAAACVLLVSSGLLMRSFVHVLDVKLGYDPTRTATMRVDPPRRFRDLMEANGYYDDVVRRVRAIPGVNAASLGDLLPFGGDRSWGVAGEGQVYARDEYPEAFIRVVGTGWFGTMGIPMKEGRDFSDGDAPDSPRVVIVNETLARTLWPGRDAVGQAIQRQSGLLRVVGVVGDVRHDALEGKLTGELYFPMRQYSDGGAVNLVVRTKLPQSQLAQQVRSALAQVAPFVARNEWRPLQQLVDKVLSPRRFLVMLLGGFTAFALLLAALGIYALVSYGVSRRANEIGIRMALGATARDVSALVMRGTLALAASGTVIGIAAAAAVVPSLRGMLFGVGWADPATFAGAFLMLFAVALAAGWLPARRASRMDPVDALREG
jgi:predicted permease